MLDKNESPFDLPGKIKAEILEKIASTPFNRYPDHAYGELKGKLGALWGVPPSSVVLGNGGDEILWMVFSAFLRPGDTVLAFTPTFSEYYRLTELFGGRFLSVPADLSGDVPAFDYDLFLKKMREESPALVLLDTPNNPTGTTLPDSFIGEVLSEGKSKVIIDEAYGEFARSTWLASAAGKQIPSGALVLKTLSKAWGSAGIRLGYALCGSSLLKGLEGAKGPFNVNVLTQAAAGVLLDHPERARETVSLLRRVRDKFFASVRNLPGWKVFPGEANFLLLRAPFSQGEILRKSEGKFAFRFPPIEPCGGENYSWIRITIGTEENMEDVLRFFQSLAEHP